MSAMPCRRSTALIFLSLVLLATVAGCKPKRVESVPATPDEAGTRPRATVPETGPEPVEVREPFPTEPPSAGEEVEPSIRELNERGVLRTVFFGYDRHDLTDTARATLGDNAKWLQAHPQRYVVVYGHCDERGSIEYNLSLGERRAAAVRDYLASLGVERSRLRIVSYGEERPAVPGHDETAWAKNRRAEFEIER
jgi:peptidoglycan-associated lipoprotein